MYKTKEELVKAAGLKTVDYALPQHWVDNMEKRMSKTNIAQHFVWTYDFNKTIGCPFPITKEGIILLCAFSINYFNN